MNNDNWIAAPDGIRLSFQKLGNGPQTVVIPNGIYLLEDLRPLAEDRTLIAYDPRNRGRSGADGEGSIGRDVDDLEAVRLHFGIERMDLIGHSYVGLMVALYAMRYPEHAGRVVQNRGDGAGSREAVSDGPRIQRWAHAEGVREARAVVAEPHGGER